jgi:signal transduction histidine kinase/ActR/RegA family two-component response regulator
MSAAAAGPLHVLIHAPIGRDAVLTAQVLERASIATEICRSMDHVCAGLSAGAGAVLLTEEALERGGVNLLASALEAQPAWSDISVLLFAGGDRREASLRTLRKLELLRNVTLLDRPIRVTAVVSTVQTALRGRRRQYQLRDVLVDLHAARSTAEQASRLKDEFLATLSHELRTPLNAILGWISMLCERRIESERVPEILEVVRRNAQAQAQLIADVLDVSRMITGRVRLDVSDVNVFAVLADAVDTVQPGADAKGLHLHVPPMPQRMPRVRGDASRLQQVFWNLLSNAVKFTPRGGRVEVRLTTDGETVEVAVSDTGAGLSPDFLPYAFERFRQADQSFTRTYGGLGLGLAIVKTLVELHGGQVEAQSDGRGLGATFRVRLPIAGAATALASGEDGLHSPTPPRPDFGGRLILVVENDPTTRELLVTLLTQCNARVAAAESAAAAISRLDADVPALLLADIGMPDEDGLSMMRRIRQRPAALGGMIPSVALSAYAGDKDREAALDAGFDEFVEKPVTPAHVIRTIEKRLLDAVPDNPIG